MRHRKPDSSGLGLWLPWPLAAAIALGAGCAPTIPDPAEESAARRVSGPDWSFAVPRDYDVSMPADAIVEARGPDRTRVTLSRRLGVRLAPEEETTARIRRGVEPPGVAEGPGERTLQRTSSTGAVGLTLRCTAPDARVATCERILGTFRVHP